ncbi:hypothetical protein M4H79_001870 [Listeria monocytogenes]|uniref:hypothetical protein n=1 Tax=Listeria monocytogenes TaxID=1639 RepID=UPI000BDF1B3E|nr:hypothetical protein [Listeria monocytogenes]EAG7202377.1 hypothetical protein [Listeria monocytogenes]EAH3144475.1 hypothetical protein [Listeria monocytogenes]ECX5815564.1 hypothetical protein [Listeria monocytogenes]EEA8547207.1 hypothetical protein [Listeria monocytogenes]EJB6206207.1 hypothetical protein [Listeria monocytogenes]
MNAYITPSELASLTNLSIEPTEADNLIKAASVAIDKQIMPNIIDSNNVDAEIKQAVAWQCEHIKKYGEFIGIGNFTLGKLTMGGQSQNSNNFIPDLPDKVMDLLLSSGWLYAGAGGF